MKHGFVKVAAATPDIRVADVEYNTGKICEAIEEADDNRAKILVFPELCVTGYTCGDLFTQDILLETGFAGPWKRSLHLRPDRIFWLLSACRCALTESSTMLRLR